jgi:hypothetical protein
MNNNNSVHYALEREWRRIDNNINTLESDSTRLNKQIFATCEGLNKLRAAKLELERFAAKNGLPPLDHAPVNTNTSTPLEDPFV